MSKQITQVLGTFLKALDAAHYSLSADAHLALAELRREFYALSSAAPSAAEPVAQWRPIETAPKDGYFLAFKPGTGYFVATILDMEHPDCEFDGGVHEAWSHHYVDGVTYWMPLPSEPDSAPPAPQAASEPASVAGLSGDAEREAFEKWAPTVHLRVDRWNVNPELYDDEDTISAWQGWQARATLTVAQPEAETSAEKAK